ncbi:MAG TPA: hypothetical protein PL110_09095 [Candidatus Eremiobacteraeota bacterium]|nr:MAG: Succinate dehydrogenase/Fumarate reductase transmembrane subunit [bacterium ADurb.Bin363]HPZ08258.1 hypothetical protein [Candidatus Eremiobacteraeota bacterium]
MIRKLFAFIIEIPDNFHLEMLCFAGQRLSGILLALYLFAHIFVISTATLWGGDAFTAVMKAMHHPVLIVLEILLFAGVVAHMLNGIRIILGDFFALTKAQKSMISIIALIGFLVVSIGGFIMLYNFSQFHS